jgi:hypothetical protein
MPMLASGTDPRTAGSMLCATHRERRATHRGILGTANQVGEVESMTRALDTGRNCILSI